MTKHILITLLAICIVYGCKEDKRPTSHIIDPPDTGSDGDTDADTDADSDADADADSDADADADSDGDTDGDSDSNNDSGTNNDTDSENDIETDDLMDTDLGDCQTNADCVDGTCVQIPWLPGGYWACKDTIPQQPATSSSEHFENDACSKKEDCLENCDCYLVQELSPGFIYPHNLCRCHECDEDSDCAKNQLCIPAGVWDLPTNQCVNTECKVHSDCAADESDTVSKCLPYQDKCSALPFSFLGKYCQYADDPCKTDDDCDTGQCLPIVFTTQTSDNTGYVCGEPSCLE